MSTRLCVFLLLSAGHRAAYKGIREWLKVRGVSEVRGHAGLNQLFGKLCRAFKGCRLHELGSSYPAGFGLPKLNVLAGNHGFDL
jgi:hypothetical protein